MASLALTPDFPGLYQPSWRNTLTWVAGALIAHIALIAAFLLLQPSAPQMPDIFNVTLLPMAPAAPTPPAPAPKAQPVIKRTHHRVIPKPAPVPTPTAISRPTPAAAPSTAESTPSTTPPSGANKPNPANVVSNPIYNANYLNNPRPAYPAMSTRLGEEGLVKLEVQVKADGTAGKVTLYRSSGYSRLDDAAIDAVKHWKFVPAKRGGQAIAGIVIVPVSFTLEK